MTMYSKIDLINTRLRCLNRALSRHLVHERFLASFLHNITALRYVTLSYTGSLLFISNLRTHPKQILGHIMLG
jgi:hypothetical protein